MFGAGLLSTSHRSISLHHVTLEKQGNSCAIVVGQHPTPRHGPGPKEHSSSLLSYALHATYPFQPTHLVSPILVSTANPTESPRTSSTSRRPSQPFQPNDRTGIDIKAVLTTMQRTRNPTDCGRRPTSLVRAGTRAGGDAVGMEGREKVARTCEAVVCVFLSGRRHWAGFQGLTTDSKELLGQSRREQILFRLIGRGVGEKLAKCRCSFVQSDWDWWSIPK
jgi:hypothetical protein